MLEGEKDELMNQVVTLEKSIAVSAKEQQTRTQTMKAEYEAALAQVQERGQVALQQANRCCQELAAQLQLVCNEREEAERTWSDREKQLKVESEKCLSTLKEKLSEKEKERSFMADTANKLREEMSNAVQQMGQVKREAGAREEELR